MAQSVTGGVLFDAAGGQAHAQGVLHGWHAHGLAGLPHGAGQRTRAFLPAATYAGQEPARVAVEAPVLAPLFDHGGGNGHLAHLAALAVDDAQDAALVINVPWLDSNGLADAQAAMINQGQHGAEAPAAHRAQKLAGLPAGQHDRQRMVAPDGELFPQDPGESGEIAEEHPQSDDRLIEGGGSQFLDDAQVNEVIEDLAFADPAKLAPGVMRAQLAHLAEVLGFAAAPQCF